ncbi:hypothetical protein [Allopusillimonas ginsengisoli]|nr:hypothetical protein [Allopusillimonas ginsengisoli]
MQTHLGKEREDVFSVFVVMDLTTDDRAAIDAYHHVQTVKLPTDGRLQT